MKSMPAGRASGWRTLGRVLRNGGRRGPDAARRQRSSGRLDGNLWHALEYDPTYRAAMKERDAGLEERAIGRAALLPNLSFQYQNGRNSSEVTQPTTFGPTTSNRDYRSYSSSLNLQQPIFDYEAISRYYYGVAQARYDLAQEIEAQDNLDAALRALASMVGQPVRAEDLAPLTGGVEVKPLEPATFDGWHGLALANNPELAAQHHSLDAAQERIEQARAGHMPKVSLYASAGRQKSNSEATFDQHYVTNSIGLQLSVPIFAGGGVSATVRQAVDNRERLRYENDAKLNETLNDLRKQFNLYNSSAAKMRAYQFAVNSARELTVAMKRSVAGGERVNADVLDAEQQYYDALRNLAQARYAYLLSGLRLKFYAGTLSQDDVRTLSGYFGREAWGK